MNWPYAILTLVILFRIGVWAVTAYAVFWLDRSGWWFALAILLTCGDVNLKAGES